MKTAIHTTVVIVVGTLIGGTINKVASTIWSQNSNYIALLSNSLNTGLNPTTVDLGVIQFTLGLIFKINIATVIGIFLTALIYKQLIK